MTDQTHPIFGYYAEIIGGIYLGSQWATQPNVLQSLGIDAVLNVSCAEADCNHGRYHIAHKLVLDINDSPTATDRMRDDVLPQALAFLDQHHDAGRRILVHCSAGRSRSATVLIAWLMKRLPKPYEDVYELMNNKRNIQPNQGFITLLKSL